ncbi:IucA/IucC family protein [Actinomadura rugatobispora]|uniref:IucA/IucC family protein n=1 Tax=Actinomadura rugatobispora TaxID=1994 RepID=A0ABW1A1I2_9ACTN|nr:IucA/IucC family protein [Actinomadura rugatobispora]
MNEATLAARVLDALLREDYAGLRRFARGRTLDLPGGGRRSVRLIGGGFLSTHVVDPAQDLRLDDVLALVRSLADPRDDVAAFERECREMLATARLHESAQPAVLERLARLPDELRVGPGAYYETLAAYTDHPVHPMGRCRLGLEPEDLERHAPEFAPTFPMHWARVPSERVTEMGVLPEWWPGDGLFPVHPLTVPHLTGVTFAPEPRVPVAPTLSMRSMVVEADRLTHLKVPLPTSTLGLRNRRTIVPRTLPDGALAERLLRRVLQEEPRLPILLADEQTYGHADSPLLAYLVRRFPPETARAHVVPVAALLARAPEGGFVIERWDVPTLFGAYLDALLSWNVTLFRRGIALEAHQQNVSLVLDAAFPQDGLEGGGLKLLVKDYDGTLVLGDGESHEGSFIDPRMATQDPEALARVFVTITLHLCAAAPAFGLAERGLLPLPDGLAMIRDRLDAALGPGDAFLRARTLDAGTLPTKAMVTAGTLVDKARTGSADINKHYGPPGPNYLRDDTCC